MDLGSGDWVLHDLLAVDLTGGILLDRNNSLFGFE
jgi:hypothetical protein